MKSSPLTKLKWTKRMSFADEYAFHDDCLLSGVKEIIAKDIQVTQELMKRKLERVRKALEKKRKRERCNLERRTILG